VRTVPFRTVLDSILLRQGIDPRGVVETLDHLKAINGINTEVREAWEHQPWPEWTPTEKRYYRPWWNNAESYEPDDEVWDFTVDAYYRCVVANNGLIPSQSNSWEPLTKRTWAAPLPWDSTITYATGQIVTSGGNTYTAIATSTNEAPPNSAYWAVIAPPCEPEEPRPSPGFDRYISLDQVRGDGTPHTPIGTVIRMTRSNPDTKQRTPDLEYYFSTNGIQVGDDAGNTVWIQFRLRPPTFTHSPWLATSAYVAGQLAYDASVTGECYLALQSSTGQAPGSSPAYWQKINFPYVLAEIVKRKVLAALKVDEEKLPMAAVHMAQGDTALADEWDKVEGQQGQERRFTVNVRGGCGRRLNW
jgi:hypothetical protein